MTAKCKVCGSANLQTDPPTRVTNWRIRNKFEAEYAVQGIYKQQRERPHTSTSPVSSAVVIQQFTLSPK